MAGRPPGPTGIRLTDEHRTKIANSKILNRLIGHAEGTEEMSATQVTAALGLLKKALPDLQAVTISGDQDNPLQHKHEVRVIGI
jgi:hypothetical protein